VGAALGLTGRAIIEDVVVVVVIAGVAAAAAAATGAGGEGRSRPMKWNLAGSGERGGGDTVLARERYEATSPEPPIIFTGARDVGDDCASVDEDTEDVDVDKDREGSGVPSAVGASSPELNVRERCRCCTRCPASGGGGGERWCNVLPPPPLQPSRPGRGGWAAAPVAPDRGGTGGGARARGEMQADTESDGDELDRGSCCCAFRGALSEELLRYRPVASSADLDDANDCNDTNECACAQTRLGREQSRNTK
jgi:hypothetical protein